MDSGGKRGLKSKNEKMWGVREMPLDYIDRATKTGPAASASARGYPNGTKTPGEREANRSPSVWNGVCESKGNEYEGISGKGKKRLG